MAKEATEKDEAALSEEEKRRKAEQAKAKDKDTDVEESRADIRQIKEGAGPKVIGSGVPVIHPGSPSEVDEPMDDDLRPGVVRPLRAQPRWAEDVKPVESDPALLESIQDPYGERAGKETPMVPTTDSYGNFVLMPV